MCRIAVYVAYTICEMHGGLAICAVYAFVQYMNLAIRAICVARAICVVYVVFAVYAMQLYMEYVQCVCAIHAVHVVYATS